MLIGRVVGDMAVEHPFTRPVRSKLNIIAFSGRDSYDIFGPLGSLGNIVSIRCYNIEGEYVQVHRMDHLSAADKTKAYFLTYLCGNIFSIGKRFPVNRKEVSVH